MYYVTSKSTIDIYCLLFGYLQVLQNMLRFAELLEGVQKTLDRIDVKLGEVMLHNSEDECERWLLESTNSESMGFSAADVVLGVILNKLSLLGTNGSMIDQRA